MSAQYYDSARRDISGFHGERTGTCHVPQKRRETGSAEKSEKREVKEERKTKKYHTYRK